MNQIQVDPEKCKLCGTCEAVCFRHLIKIKKDRVDASTADQHCAFCGQCQAVCPTGALVHTKMDQDGFKPIKGGTGIDAETLTGFFRSRRSHRNFKPAPIPDELISTIARSCCYAPSSSNDSCLGLVIVRNQDKLRELGLMAARHLDASASEAITRCEDMAQTGPLETRQANELERAQKLARFLNSAPPDQDPILYHAPLAVFVHSSPYTNFPKENAMVAAHTAMLTAHALGLGACYISLMARAANEQPRIKDELQVPAENEIHAVIAMGYPKYRYARTTPARTIPIQFIGD